LIYNIFDDIFIYKIMQIKKVEEEYVGK